MKKQIFSSCTMFFAIGLAANQTLASAQETPGLEGVWLAVVTPVDCVTQVPIKDALSFRGLNMFNRDGSMTNDAAFLVPPNPIARRGAGLGGWRRTQGQTYTATFWFFRYSNIDGAFLSMRRVTLVTVNLQGDQFTSFDMFQDFDAQTPPQPISMPGSTGCNIEHATRVQGM
jgi:hypothetical protein